MKLRKTLTIGGKAAKLVEEDIRLDVASPGRAFFRVRATEALSGIVQFSLGYSSQDKNQLFFSGYIESSHTVDTATQKIFCREMAAALNLRLPISLRHPTLKDVLAAYSDKTGLVFTVPDEPYATTRIPHFHTLGSGYHGMDQLGAVFGIEKYYWQPQPDGTVWVGSWNNSRWATRPVNIDEKVFTGVTAAGAKVLPAIPALRPGVFLNGQYLTSLQLTGHEMVIQCENSLSA
ncbi:hypothetical protein ACQ0P8_16240 (plasmid) [Halodesulfovibrio aestuarii]|uniref:Uncharacterized protein n=1 Tax=Halodesulfovibrio aestuarii TaxID=126333 RepID=A0A8G2CC83_9BACT|nr:hypothetical protein [Halodesulfovibrio aestuarii]SHJ72477.1 hypothetical protein SAMN05660830_03090 [Halodesulfovibrio aestuarii]